jgi:ketosteroid isomerase-like protein
MTTTKTSLVETVQSMYAAFGRGDIMSVLAPMHPDVKWSINVDPAVPGASAVPVFRPFNGAADVANFFAYLSRDLDFHSFEPLSFTSSALEVVARVQMDLTVRPTKRRMQTESLHLFTFNGEGRLVRFREYSDTLAVAAAWGGLQS